MCAPAHTRVLCICKSYKTLVTVLASTFCYLLLGKLWGSVPENELKQLNSIQYYHLHFVGKLGEANDWDLTFNMLTVMRKGVCVVGMQDSHCCGVVQMKWAAGSTVNQDLVTLAGWALSTLLLRVGWRIRPNILTSSSHTLHHALCGKDISQFP